jgi:hypothetical protein
VFGVAPKPNNCGAVDEPKGENDGTEVEVTPNGATEPNVGTVFG